MAHTTHAKRKWLDACISEFNENPVMIEVDVTCIRERVVIYNRTLKCSHHPGFLTTFRIGLAVVLVHALLLLIQLFILLHKISFFFFCNGCERL